MKDFRSFDHPILLESFDIAKTDCILALSPHSDDFDAVGIFIESLLPDDLVDDLRCDTGHLGQARKPLVEVVATQDVIHVEHDRCGTFAHFLIRIPYIVRILATDSIA